MQLLEQCHDPATVRRIAALGVTDGWSCLEAGAGGGSITRWLCSRVGSSGQVLAVDLDTRLPENLDAPNLETRRMDLVSDQLSTDAFHFVHTRLVLMHIPEREWVLQRLIAALRPGGVLLCEEHDVHAVWATGSEPYQRAWELFLPAMQAAGVAPTWARGLPEVLDRNGLVEVEAEVDAPLFRGASPTATFWSLSWLQSRDRVVAAGAPVEVLDQGGAALDDPTCWFHGPAMVAAWGRRPE